MPAKKKPTHDQLRKARDTAERRFGNRDYVTGIDVGYKWTDGRQTDELCVRLHVEEKRTESQLEAAEVFPKEIGGVKVDVYEATYATQRMTLPHEHQSRRHVLKPGISVSHPKVTAGTLGYFAADKDTGEVGLVSNWHVLVGPRGRNGDATIQPGSADGGYTPNDEIGRLSRSILERAGDAAFSVLNRQRRWEVSPLGLEAIPTSIRKSRLGEVVRKSGRTTAVTQGKVDGEGGQDLIIIRRAVKCT